MNVGERVGRVVGGRCLVDGVLDSADLSVGADGRLTAVSAPGRPLGDDLDVDGMIVAPGFVDVQCNGAGGHDLTADPSSLDVVAATITQFGVTSFCPTVITSSARTRRAALDAMAHHRSSRADTRTEAEAEAESAADRLTAEAIGLHLEGPVLSSARLGTHDADHVGLPSDDEIDEWCAGDVALVTLAPEVDGALGLVDRLVSAAITVSIGHSDATAADVDDAVRHGVRSVTHLYNAMRPLHHREPGVVGAALARDDLFVGIVADGAHVLPDAVLVAWRCVGERLVLVSDASAALGAPDGEYTIGTATITATDGVVTNGAGALAGSALAMNDAVRNLVDFTGCSLPEALTAASTAPAQLLGLTDRGAIEPGRRADLVVLDDRLDVVATIVNGVIAWKS